MTPPSTSPAQVKILVPGNHLMVGLLGQHDELLRVIEEAFSGTRIHVRGNEITIEGADAERVGKLFEELVVLLQEGHALDAAHVGRTIDMVKADERPSEVLTAEVLRSARGRPVRPKTSGQKTYVDAIRKNVVTFGIGPAGTGKSYLAVALAVQALQDKEVERILLTRPAVEAGERLGFLPGDLMAKVDPYLRPLYDALFDMLGPEAVSRLMERGTIEVAPLAFMRGRAQPVDRRVLTPWGWRRIGDLEAGDLVVGSNGAPTPVLGVFPQGRREVFRVRTQDGAETLACAEHLWWVTTLDDRKHRKPGRVVQTQEMIGRLRRHHQRRFELPLVSAPVEFAPRPVAMDPYALGLLLGDGCITTKTTASETVASHSGPTSTVVREWTGQARAGVLPEYLFNSPDVRMAVLQGLLDAGATVAATRDDRIIEHKTRSRNLHGDVLFLVHSLGGVAPSRATTSQYILDIRLPAGIEPFRLERKAAKYREFGAGRPMRFVDSIEPAGEAETVCIQVGAADSLYVTDDFLVTHNTLNQSFIILDEAQNTSPEQMKMFLTRIGFGSKAVVTGDVTQIDLAGGKSGLLDLERILGNIEGVAFVHLTRRDVVRHRIVQEIVAAYERHQP